MFSLFSMIWRTCICGLLRIKPENALGKMQLRSYMNGHSRQGERPFPFSAKKGFVRSHRMQRKHYRGLSNPQCLHGIEFVASPSLLCVSEEDKKRWMDLTGRDLKFTIPPDASDFDSWRNLPNTDIELERPPHVTKPAPNNAKKILNGSGLHLTSNASFSSNGDSSDQSPGGGGGDNNNKKRKEKTQLFTRSHYIHYDVIAYKDIHTSSFGYIF